ncbi:MAG TPA: DUF4910 domain-containing protein [Patescibacteria group bacterium]|nr:DUF4910 domain-containing protein [Patescibacteria group bacterium]
MFKEILDKLKAEVSGDIAYNYVAEVSRHHRIQASPGIRAAVNYAVETMNGFGVKSEVDEYTADGKGMSWGSLRFKEWSCDDAELRLVHPEERILARWSETKFSLIQRSYPTPKKGVEAEVVVLEKGEEETDYRKVDVKGKLVLTSGDVIRVHALAVEKRGALGIIYDGMFVRPPTLKEGELDDDLKYTSFWWYGDEKPAFGFVLSPREGRRLRKLVAEGEKKNDPVRVWAKVDSKLYKGSIENAVATIPGETDERVVVIAHICHPQPSANDNASGCGAAMEAARVLGKLIGDGKLPKPRRSIVFTLVPEMAGSYNYLARNEDSLSKMVAAVNLDMVGENQELCGSILTVTRTPEALPSFVNTLMEGILEEVKAEADILGSSAKFPLFRCAMAPYSGGSDHYIYSDPSVGVPCLMLLQWPDKFYHTMWDTLEKVDPEMLRRVALMTATYAYFAASAGPTEAVWLVNEVAARERRDVAEYTRGVVYDTVNAPMGERAAKLAEALAHLKEAMPYRLGRSVEAIRSVSRLARGNPTYAEAEERLVSELESSVKSERRQAERAIQEFAEASGLAPLPKHRKPRMRKAERMAAEIVPKRVFRGPVSTRSWQNRLSETDREALRTLGAEHPLGRSLGGLALFWTDGERSLREISRLVWLEKGVEDVEYLLEYYGLLEKMGLVALV